MKREKLKELFLNPENWDHKFVWEIGDVYTKSFGPKDAHVLIHVVPIDLDPESRPIYIYYNAPVVSGLEILASCAADAVLQLGNFMISPFEDEYPKWLAGFADRAVEELMENVE